MEIIDACVNYIEALQTQLSHVQKSSEESSEEIHDLINNNIENEDSDEIETIDKENICELSRGT